MHRLWSFPKDVIGQQQPFALYVCNLDDFICQLTPYCRWRDLTRSSSMSKRELVASTANEK